MTDRPRYDTAHLIPETPVDDPYSDDLPTPTIYAGRPGDDREHYYRLDEDRVRPLRFD